MSRKNGKEKILFSHIRPKSAIAEAFRTLRTNIGFSSYSGANKIILTTSPAPDEGKSTVSTNLAIVLAQAQSRILLVDCDLRKPVLHQYFELDNRRGLTNLLVQDLAVEDVIQTTRVDGMHVITSGPIPPNPSELLGSDRMAGLLARVRELYDVALLDTPPVIAVTDAALLAPQADSVLLVLKAGSTRIEMAQEARNLLQNVGVKSISVVLNAVELHGGGYYNYYSYYGDKDKDKDQPSIT